VIGLRFTFTAGRYHATGWDHHVNEGVVEWPPAPWRILRALIGASYRLPESERSGMPELIERLAALPVYRLPQCTTAHIRHYMPTDGSPVKILDTFVAVGDGARAPAEVLVWWPELELDTGERELLERVSEQISYLGRAESWVEVEVMDIDESLEANAAPQVVDEPSEGETTRLLAAQHTDELAAWRERWERSAGQAKQRKKSRRSLPGSVWEALHVTTSELQRERWSQAPGSCWVEYRLGQRPYVRPRSRTTPRRGPQGAVFLLESAVKPTVDQTLPIAERMRTMVMKVAADLGSQIPGQLSGKDEHGCPLVGHSHAYFLPLSRRDREGRERIDRVLIWARDGLDSDAWACLQQAATSGRRLRGSAEGHPLNVILAGYGDSEELRAMLAFNPARPNDGSWLDPAREWISETPFVPPKFWKFRGGRVVDAPEDQLRWLIRETLGEVDVCIERLQGRQGETNRWHEFVRARKKDRERLGGRPGLGFRIKFTEPVAGPIALGYGAHFGLGLFRPCAS